MAARDDIQPYDTIPELLSTIRGERSPQKMALSCYAGAVKTGELTYSEYLGSIDAWAQFLSLSCGIAKGDRVATLLRNRIEVPILYLALMSIGAVVVPLNPSYSQDEMAFVLTDSGAIGVLTDKPTGEARSGEFSKLGFCLFIEDERPAAVDHSHCIAIDRADPAITLYTSGTTSFPKGVVQTHGNLIANANSMVKEFGIREPNQYSVMPFYHAHAVGFGMMTCLLSGGHLIVTDKMDASAWPKVIQKERVTVTSMVPNLLNMLVLTKVTHYDVPTLGFVFVSAAPLPTVLADRFEKQSGIRVAHAWGLSEFTNFATALPADTETVLRTELMFGHETPCVGRPLAGVEVQVRRTDGTEADPSERGELWVRGPSLTLGYHNNSEATAAAIQDGWLRSGDEGYYVTHADIKYFFISDRIKDVIIRSGEKISPAAVEAIIAKRLPDFANRIVVVGYPHTIYGEEIGLVIEGSEADSPVELLAEILKGIPVRSRPKVVLCGDSLIARTHTGKIQRRMLKPLFASFENKSPALHIERI